MLGLATGTVVGGRYALIRALSAEAEPQVWEATDTVRHLPVNVVALSSRHPQAAAVLDAARRAATIESSRLVRILDIGSGDGVTYFVEESLTGARSLSQLARDGGLAAEEVRRLTGEAATALDAAGSRGLHHLGLTPDNVLRLPDGSVKVAGLATQAAVAGQDHIGGERALRRDARGLVALAYAGLTGRWPYAGDVGLEPAPRMFGGVPRPSEIAVGVPADLDAICRLTLNDDLGPVSPADYAAQIAPWAGHPGAFTPARPSEPSESALTPAPRPVSGVDLAPAVAPTPAPAIPPAPPLATAPIAVLPPTPAPTLAAPAVAPTPAPAIPPAPALATAPIAVLPPTPAAPAAAPTPPTAPTSAVTPDPSSAPAEDEDAPIVGGQDSADELTEMWETPPDSTSGVDSATSGGAVPPLVVGSVAGSEGGLLDSVRTGATTLVERISEAAASAGDRISGAVAEFRRPQATDYPDDPSYPNDPEVSESSYPEGPRYDESLPYQAPAPLLPAEAGAPPSLAQRRYVLMLFAGLCAVALLLGIAGASRIGRNSDLEALLGPDPTARITTSTTGPTTSESGGGDAEELFISGATGYDPEGIGGDENNDLAARVFDGNPATYWQSEGYQGPKFGGLKAGVGLLVDLGTTATPKQIVLNLPTPNSFEIYLSPEPDRGTATPFGQQTGVTGVVTATVPAGTTGRYVIVWFTDAPQGQDGWFRATLAEVSVRG